MKSANASSLPKQRPPTDTKADNGIQVLVRAKHEGSPTQKSSSQGTDKGLVKEQPKASTASSSKELKGGSEITRKQSQLPVSYLAALKSGNAASSSSQVVAARNSSPKVIDKVQAKAPATAKQSVPASASSKKWKPTSILEVDLLSLAVKARQQEVAQKSQKAAASQASTQKPKKSVPQKIGKVKGPGALARNRRRLTVLKKQIKQERRVDYWLLHPEKKPFPIAAHPAFIEHECAFLPAYAIRSIHDMIDHEQNSLDGESAYPEVNEINPASETENQPEESTATVQKLRDEEIDGGGTDADDDDEDDKTLTSSDDDTDESEHEGIVPRSVVKPKVASFDPTLISPVFFGGIYLRKQSSISTSTQVGEADEPKKRFFEAPRAQALRPMREYVDQALSRDLDDVCEKMLTTLYKFQTRARLEDEINARLRRRLVLGLHEVKRGVLSRRCVAVVVAPNVENVQALDEKLEQILTICRDTGTKDEPKEPIPVIFAMDKRSIGRVFKRMLRVTCVGIYSADGAHELLKQAIKLSSTLTTFYKSQVESETRQALLGNVLRCGICQCDITGFLRYDCLECRRTFCEPCSSRNQAKNVPCVSNKVSNCNIVRVVRDPPQVKNATPRLMNVNLDDPEVATVGSENNDPRTPVTSEPHSTSMQDGPGSVLSVCAAVSEIKLGQHPIDVKEKPKLRAAAQEFVPSFLKVTSPPTSLAKSW